MGHAPDTAGVVLHHHPALAPAHHRQRHLQLPGAARAGVRHTAIDADLGGRVETQPQTAVDLMQAMLQVGVETLGVEAAEQGLAGKILARRLQVAELLAAAQGPAGGGQAIDETEPLGRANHPLIGTGQHRRIEHHHPAIQLRTTQRRMQMQDAAEGMADTPHRLGLLLQMVDQFVHQVQPVVVRRKARIVGVLLQMRHLIFGCQGGEQLAIGTRGKSVGVSEKHLLRHTG